MENRKYEYAIYIYIYDDIKLGDKFSFKETITHEKMNMFLNITKDVSPIHISNEYAKNSGFENRVVYGMLTASFYSTLVGVYLPGENCILQELDIKFNNPLYIGQEIEISGEVVKKDDTFKRLEIKATIRTKEKLISKAKIKVGVRK